MATAKPTVGVLLTLLELYRDAHPEIPSAFRTRWESIVRELLEDRANLHFSPVAHTAEEVAAAVGACEQAECDLLLVLPMAYAASGSAREALIRSPLPLVLVSTARDATLPHDMGSDEIMANHAVHGVQDLANVLGRAGRRFQLIAGAHTDERFRERLCRAVRTSGAARVLRRGTVGRLGAPFEGMLDFAFDRSTLSKRLGLKVEEISVERFASFGRSVAEAEAAEYADWARERFQVDAGLTDDELLTSAVWSLALERLVEEKSLDAISMNFLAVAKPPSGELTVAGDSAETLPFLGASRLMTRGIGYAGEGDVLTAALVAAVARTAGEATFTEMFCPDYARDEILLSHMGECNFAMANPARPVRLVAKPFSYGDCKRPAVPVFQLRPGPVTLASLTEWPGEGFRLIATAGEIVEAPEHVNLRSPYSRVTFGRPLPAFLEAYSEAGGTHHLALGYGDLREDLRALAGLCGIGFRVV